MNAPTASRLGFDGAKLAFGFRTATAACLALLLAWLAGLEHPQWAGMTVWAASQPLRGHLLEKSEARLAGTIIGVVFGLALMRISRGDPTVLVIGISLWIGLCAFAGNLVRGYASYAALLSGYSAAMVALLDAAHPEHVLALGADRVLTVAVGILAALLVGWLFAAPGDDVSVLEKVRLLNARLVADIVARLNGAPVSENGQRSILTDISALEGLLDLHGAGSRNRRRLVRKVRAVLAAQVSAVLWLRSDDSRAIDASLVGLSADTKLSDTGVSAPALRHLCEAVVAATPQGALTSVLNDLVVSTTSLDDLDDGPATDLLLHRDWMLARRAMLRAFVAMLATGLVWLVTGWEMGGFMMLGAAIMLSVFSTFEKPAAILPHVLAGQVLGAGLALICRWLVWPHVGGSLGAVLAMVPFILLCAPLSAHRLTQRMAFDVSMVMLLMLQPSGPQTMTFGHSLMASLAVVAGPVVGLLAFSLIYPVDSRRRYEAVRYAMIDDLEHLAASALQSDRRKQWRALLHHRVLLAVYWGERASYPTPRLAEDALALLHVGQAIEQLGELAARATSPGVKRRCAATLERLHRIGTDPLRAARALLAMVRRLPAEMTGGTMVLAQAAAKLAERPAAFRKTASGAR
ncbi:FUSC family protein [Bradyrhizobium sp. SRS-191]|uniref:FUSC family protein n=1 Tax=Bradyrhizobium sp. SRS-191 TaxID=2962606 RepID=UPI00211DC832|nr:FUSC family protein [Bradyrhizobium sp. SRS-191]